MRVRSLVSPQICYKRSAKIIVSKINENEFLVEGDIEYARFGSEIDQSILTFVDIKDGPFLHIGKDFFGKGNIKKIERLPHKELVIKLTL